jgi:predicted amidohydrolase YtcJ
MLFSPRVPLLIVLLAMMPGVWAADLLVTNVNGYTLDSSGHLQHFQALLVDQGKVVATGNDAELAQRAGNARVVDGHGKTLLPGLTDSHGHVMQLGRIRNQIDLSQTASLAQALAAVKAYASAHPDAVWIRGGGWNQELWKLGRFPTAQELDTVVMSRPVWLERIDGHSGWANNAAMKLAGITKETRDPTGGRIERDATGNPTGVFVDAAAALIDGKISPPTTSEQTVALDTALAELARLGITSVDDPGIDLATYQLYRQYADAHKLTARIYALIHNTGADFDTISEHGPLIGYGGDFLTVRGVKLFADGALGSRGAAMLAPYSDDSGNSGRLFQTPAELTAMIGKALGKDYQVAIHAIGDRANREVLDSFEAAYKQHGGENLRNRVEHAQIVSPQDFPRFVSLHLIASMQAVHATSDMNMAEDRIGHQRILGAYAWQRFLKQGTMIVGGSDFPFDSDNPFDGLHAAVTRQDHHNLPTGGWYPAQDMTLLQAFRAYTLDAAWACYHERSLGTLEPGNGPTSS